MLLSLMLDKNFHLKTLGGIKLFNNINFFLLRTISNVIILIENDINYSKFSEYIVFINLFQKKIFDGKILKKKFHLQSVQISKKL